MKVVLRIEVKDEAGNAVGGAHINIWHDTWGPDPGPPDYQEETDVNGVREIPVLSGKTAELYIEINKGDLWSKANVKFSSARYAADGPRILHQTVLKKLRSGDEKREVNVVVHVQQAKEGNSAGEPLGGVRIAFYDSSSRRVRAEGTTDPSGNVTIPAVAWDYSIEATKDGYEPGKSAVYLNAFQRGKTITAPTIILKKKAETATQASAEVIVTVRNAADKNVVNGARVVLTGKRGVTSGVYSGTTVDGVARIPIREFGSFDLEITQEYFEPLNEEVKVAVGDPELPDFFLKEKPKAAEAGDIVKVKVLAGDRKNAPIARAAVTVNQKTTYTGVDGIATLNTTLGFDAGYVVVTAAAEGYKRQSKSVQIKRGVRYNDAGAATTIVLEPGEDVASDDTPIRLVVEIIDSFTNQPLNGKTNVQVRFKGKIVAIEDTNDVGEARIEIKDSERWPLSELRTGLKIDVYHDNYVPRDSDIASSQLLPSSVPRIVTLHLERDWTELRKSLATLEGRVTAWNKDVLLVSEKAASVKKLVSETRAAELQASKIADGLGRGFSSDNIPGGRPSVAAMCRKAGELKQSIQEYETEALSKERSLKQLLDNAESAAANCKSAQQAESVRRDYNAAVRLSGEIGALVNKARTANQQLSTVAAMLKERPKISDQESQLAEIVKLSLAADQAAINAEVDTRRAEGLSKQLSGRRDALTGELATLRTTYGINKSVAGLPADLKQRLDTIESLLGSRNNDVMSGPDPNAPGLVKASAEKIREIKTSAELAVFSLKNSEAQCEVAPMNEAFERMGNAITSASIELSAAANLRSKADDCARRGACQPILADVRGLLESDDVETAAAKVSAAHAQGCDVSEAEKELDYWSTVRQTANLIASSVDSCRFQEALNIGERIPAGIKSRPRVAEALEVARRGAQARQRIAELRESARNIVARMNDYTAAKPYITQAEQAAEGFPCLAQEVAKFRNEYKITAFIDKPTKLEELPEDADRPVAPTGTKPAGRNTTQNTRPPVNPPTVETSSTGSLQMANPWTKDAVRTACCGGSTDYAYGLTTASRQDKFPPGDGGDLTITWTFSGVPNGALTPGPEYTITVTGTFSASLANRNLDPPASGGVRIEGDVEVIKNQNAYVSRDQKREGLYVFKVRPNAKSVTISLGADYGFGTFAIYRFGEVKK
jgi:RNA-binding protein YhbY